MGKTTANFIGIIALCVMIAAAASVRVNAEASETPAYTKAQIKHRTDEIWRLIDAKPKSAELQAMEAFNLTDADLAKPVVLWK